MFFFKLTLFSFLISCHKQAKNVVYFFQKNNVKPMGRKIVTTVSKKLKCHFLSFCKNSDLYVYALKVNKEINHVRNKNINKNSTVLIL